MSVRAPERPGPRLGEAWAAPGEILREEEPQASEEAPGQQKGSDQLPPGSPALIALAAFLSTSAAAWLVGGIFKDGSARFVALGAAALGAGLVALSFRTSRPAVLQYATPAAAAVVGAAMVATEATGGSANLPGLVMEAIRDGGLADPPVPFVPGWRFLVVLLLALVGAGSASFAAAADRPKLGVFLPVPLIFGALLVQPPGSSVAHTVVALLLLVAGLAVSFGVDLAREGATSGRFEVRRFLRGGSMLLVLVVGLGALTRVGFLFPEESESQVIPPKRPEAPPPQKDRLLFVVDSERSMPWRLGVLDGYDGEAWLLPPYDESRYLPVESGADIPTGGAAAAEPGSLPSPATGARGDDGEPQTVTVSFEVSEIGGHVLPVVANAHSVDAEFTPSWDPRTQTLRLPDQRARSGMRYVVEAPVPAGAAELRGAPAPPESMKPFLEAPPAPLDIADMLAVAPDNAYDRLQVLRNELYGNVVAAGAGNPGPVPPAKVVELLRGGDGSPFEIAAAEALLARWAGVPSRIGYGYYRGIQDDDAPTRYEVRPEHGSSWLEVYFEGYGWVPIVGTPTKAKLSLSEAQKNADPTVKPSDELSVPVYVPLALGGIQAIFVMVRYWLAKLLPLLALAAFVVWVYPAVLKLGRSWRRRRWASKAGPRGRVAVAYVDLRDGAADYGVGSPHLTPLQFVQRVEPDAEHRELAWLVTRALWGDLARDLQDDDAKAAEQMANSVMRRLRQARPPSARLVAAASRTSLRNPYSDEVPNLWFELEIRRRLAAVVRAGRRAVVSLVTLRFLRDAVRRRSWRPALPLLLLVAVTMTVSGCARTLDTETIGSVRLPERVAPEELDGFTFERRENAEQAFAEGGPRALVNDGQVWVVSRDGEPVGSLQVASFKPGVRQREREVRRGIIDSIGQGQFELVRLGAERVYAHKMLERQMYLWFPPSGEYYELFVADRTLEDAEELLLALLAYQADRPLGRVDDVPDRRRGSDG